MNNCCYSLAEWFVLLNQHTLARQKKHKKTADNIKVIGGFKFALLL